MIVTFKPASVTASSGAPLRIIQLANQNASSKNNPTYKPRTRKLESVFPKPTADRVKVASMEALRASLLGRPFVLLAVNVGEGARVARGFGDKMSLQFPLLLDRDMQTSRAWGARILPASFVLGPDGRIRYSYLGAIDWAGEPVKSALERLMP